MGSRVLRYPRASQNLSRASPERLPKPVESVSKASQPEPTVFSRLLQSLSSLYSSPELLQSLSKASPEPLSRNSKAFRAQSLSLSQSLYTAFQSLSRASPELLRQSLFPASPELLQSFSRAYQSLSRVSPEPPGVSRSLVFVSVLVSKRISLF